MVETPGLLPTGASGELRPSLQEHREHSAWTMPSSHTDNGGEHRPLTVGVNAVRVLPSLGPGLCGPREHPLPEEATKNVSFSLDDGGVYKGPASNGILKKSYPRPPGISAYDNFHSQANDGVKSNGLFGNYAHRNFSNNDPNSILKSNELCMSSSNGDLLRCNEAISVPRYHYRTQVTGEPPPQSTNDQSVNYVNRNSSTERMPSTGANFSSVVDSTTNMQIVSPDVNKLNGDVNVRGVINFTHPYTLPTRNMDNEGSNYIRGAPLSMEGDSPCARNVNSNHSSGNNSTNSRHPSTCSGSAEHNPSGACHDEGPEGQHEAACRGQNRDSRPAAPAGILRHTSRGHPPTIHPPEEISHTSRINEDKEKVVRIDPKVYDLKERPKSGIRSSFMGKKHRPFLSSLNHLLGHGLSSSKAPPVNQANAASQKIEQSQAKNAVDAAEELRRAAAAGELGKIQTLLGKPGNAAGALLVNSLDEGGSSALLRAACEGRVQVIRLLLRHGANVDHQDSLHGNTGLHEACWKGYSESCAVLVKARAHLHLKNKGGFAPLHLACQNGHNQSCRVLLLAACDPNIKNNYGDTPLHTAARYGHAGVTRILLSAQADVHISNKNGDSCLHIAAAMGRRKLTKIMLEAGAVQTGRNKQGETPQDIARRKQFNQILEILQHPPAVVSPEERLKKEREQAKKESTSEKDSKRQKNKTDGKERGNKREKNDSGTSSRDSSTRPKDKKKMRGECRERGAEGCLGGVHWSPYGCHNYSAAPLQLPHVDADALPKGVLKAGEQYYVDLAGNVKKGPVAVKGSCYCAPFFRQVEHKLETDKVALMDHIDAHHEKLDKRIHSLEKKTHTHLNNIKQTVQHKICEGREECLQRVAESVTERDERLAAHKRNLQQWVEKRLEVHDSALPPLIRRTLTRTGSGRWRDPPAGHHSLARSRSEEALTEATSDLNESSYRGLRVLDHPTSMYNLHQEVDDEDTTHVYKVGASPLQSSVGVVTDRRVASDKILAKSEDEIFNEDPGRLCVIEDSSDSEGEQELPAQDASSYRINDSSSQLAQDIEKLSLDHPYYANTGAIPKSIGCSWPQSSSLTGSSTTKEIVRVDVHVPRDMVPHNKWHTYSRYEPHSNRNHLYDVQEVEPSYGNVPQSNDLEQVRDSGCSEGSSQTDIGESEQPPFSTGHEMAVPATSASSHMQDKMTPSTDGRRQIEGHLKDQVKEVSFHRDWKEISHQQQNSTEYNKHYYTAAPQKDETATYLDMDRYRIQQAVRRLYDGYLTDGRVDPRRGKAALESSLEHDSHNDSGYSTRMCTASQGPSPALSGASGVPDGSGSESRSGHSTSSPNTTVIAFPQGASTSNPSYHPASKLVVYDSSATHSPIKTYSTKNYTDDDPNGKENFKTQYSQFGHDTHSSIAPRNDNYRPLSGAVSDKHRALPAAGAAKLYPAAGHYSAPQATQQPGQRSCTRNMLDVITVGESSLV